MEMTSPLTTLGSISTPESYYTARNSPNAADETGLSSPGEDLAADHESYRDAKPLPHELRSHCQIHLEEQLYIAAINILSGLLSDGVTTPHAQHQQPSLRQKAARIPPPSQLALLATLVIHPSFTTRPPETSNLHAATHALSYLRGLLHTVGAINANFRAAFDFDISTTSNSTARNPKLIPRPASRTTTTRGRPASHTRGPTTSLPKSARSSRSRHHTPDPDPDSDPEHTTLSDDHWPTSPSPSPSASASDSEADTPLDGPFARSQLLFRRRRQGRSTTTGLGSNSGHNGPADFWAVLGWSFRCAFEHPARWRCWRVWLDLVVGVLEADFDERVALDLDRGREGLYRKKEAGVGEGEGTGEYPMLSESLLVAGYLGGLKRERRNVLREVLRAVFAFSEGESVAADRAVYREVFERETVVGRRGESKRKRGAESVVDLENDRFGDYLDGEGGIESEEGDAGEEEETDYGFGPVVPPPPHKGRKPARKSKGEGGAAAASFTLTDDIAETVPFRLRIFRLLSGAAYYLPEAFAPVGELYERFSDHVRGLPLPMFRLFVEARGSAALPGDVQVSLLRTITEALLPRQRPDPADIDPESEAGHGLTVPLLQECFLPFAANKVTAEDNAKLSLALESLLWYVYSQIDVAYSEALRRAVEKGIKAREEKIRRRGAGKADAADKAAREVLARSARNLRALVDVIAVAGR